MHEQTLHVLLMFHFYLAQWLELILEEKDEKSKDKWLAYKYLAMKKDFIKYNYQYYRSEEKEVIAIYSYIWLLILMAPSKEMDMAKQFSFIHVVTFLPYMI